MKSFKNFLKIEEKYGHVVLEPPVHGKHSSSKSFPKESKYGKPVFTPPEHGEHSKKPFRLKEESAPVTNSPMTWARASLHVSGGKTAADHDIEGEDLEKKHDLSILSDDERKSLKSYTSESYTFNSAAIHRAKAVHPAEWTSQDHDEMHRDTGIHPKELSSAISRFSAPHNMTVFHGTGFDPHKNMSSNGRFMIPGATSTSLSPLTAMQFSKPLDANGTRTSIDTPGIKHVLQIHLKQGTPAVYLGKRSTFPEERETLLPHATTYEHSGIHEDIPLEGTPHTVRIHHVFPVHMIGANWSLPEEK